MALIAALLLVSSAALAHAALLASEPADGARVPVAPRYARLVFSEAVAPLSLRLYQPSGRILPLQSFRLEQGAVVVDLPRDIGNGAAILDWRVTSQDGHAVGGTLTFSVDERTSVQPHDVDAELPLALLWLSRYLNFTLLVWGVGGCVFHFWFSPAQRFLPRSVVLVSAAGLASAVVSLGLEVADMLGPSCGTLVGSIGTWFAPVAATAGVPAALIVLAHALVIGTARLDGRGGQLTSLVATAAGALSFAVGGHAGVASPQGLMRPAILLHLVAAVFWVGSLVPMMRALADEQSIGDLLGRFSKPVLVLVAMLVCSGIVLATVQLGAPRELWDSRYGVILSMKLAAVVPLLALVGLNRLYFTPRVIARRPGAARRMQVSLAGEAVLVLAILGIASLWRFAPPPREMLAVTQSATGVQFHAHGVRGMAKLTLAPARSGPVRITINVLDADSRPLSAQGVDLAILDPKNVMEPVRRSAHRVTPSTWEVDDAVIPAAGTWLFRVDLHVSDYDRISVRASVDVAG